MAKPSIPLFVNKEGKQRLVFAMKTRKLFALSLIFTFLFLNYPATDYLSFVRSQAQQPTSLFLRFLHFIMTPTIVWQENTSDPSEYLSGFQSLSISIWMFQEMGSLWPKISERNSRTQATSAKDYISTIVRMIFKNGGVFLDKYLYPDPNSLKDIIWLNRLSIIICHIKNQGKYGHKYRPKL